VTERLGKLLLMLSSPNDGEVMAAARAIDRVLKAQRRDWHDLVRALFPHAPQWRADAEWCAGRAEFLSDWEKGFLTSLLGSRGTPTPRQLACLASIKQLIEWRQAP
jgi:hypothetical protein